MQYFFQMITFKKELMSFRFATLFDNRFYTYIWSIVTVGLNTRVNKGNKFGIKMNNLY